MFSIIGLGAVGSLLTYFLNRAGFTPYVITRTLYDRYIIRLNGDYDLSIKLVQELPSEVKYTLIAVKAYDTVNVINKIKGTPVVFQNGIGGLELIKERLGVGYSAVVTYGVTRHGNITEVKGLGEIIMPSALGELADILRSGGANVVVVDDVEPFRWLKVIVNAAINPITTILKSPNGILINNELARELALEVINEGVAVVKALGINLPRDPVAETLDVASKTSNNYSSMLQDLMNCRETEIDYINGAITKYGSLLGIPTPINKALLIIIKILRSLCLK
ncbi:ketopantoate reductase family protein [Caldivirga maquilingensis]|uniref:2-dehydropantoate 2-reductase n=1 Tax=Caldivirga maquilingensis (strain ATCC 700844 / DSM 13496 / JCM 10307 / IC-167) TaxID=397948 RepID=A8MAY0_CALMQ|nr:ketopantoate reductase family protein [Caldivirga maquilingensis]ABW02609.1 2-dehydropantoate 2-reductase [Caldivirga maquilingensis IC-167]